MNAATAAALLAIFAAMQFDFRGMVLRWRQAGRRKHAGQPRTKARR